jgi:hypothetical protein
MGKKGSYIGGSTVVKPNSNWFGLEPEFELPAAEQERLAFRNMIEAAGTGKPERSQLDAKAQLKKLTKRSVLAASDRSGTFMVETKTVAKGRRVDRVKVTKPEKS